MSFLPTGNKIDPADLGGSDQRVEYVQAADPETMERLVAQRIAAIVKENEGRATGNKLGINDIRISGGGDGHTFVTRLYLSTVDTGPGGAFVAWSGNNQNLSRVIVKFWMASTAEELQKQVRPKLAELASSEDVVGNIAADDAGASQGTRFMAFIGGAGPTQ